jgi:flagellar protein FliJ
MPFRFKLEPLQRYREHLRDRCRQALAIVLAEDAALVQRGEELAAAREQVLAEMQRLQAQPNLAVEQVAARRYHAGQLQGELRRVELERESVAERIAECRRLLSLADQGVKVLEQLETRQRQEHEKTREAKESREREEIWQAGKIAHRAAG